MVTEDPKHISFNDQRHLLIYIFEKSSSYNLTFITAGFPRLRNVPTDLSLLSGSTLHGVGTCFKAAQVLALWWPKSGHTLTSHSRTAHPEEKGRLFRLSSLPSRMQSFLAQLRRLPLLSPACIQGKAETISRPASLSAQCCSWGGVSSLHRTHC